MLRTGLVTGPELFGALRADWLELQANSPGATPFQTFEWQSIWWKHFGGNKVPMALTVHEGDDLVGLMPLTRTRLPWRAVRPMGVGPSDYLHPLARSGYEDEVAERLLERLRASRDVDLVDLHQVRETNALGVAASGAIHQATCLVLDLPPTYDEYLGMLGKSLRYDVRKLDKSLFKEGRARIEWVGETGVLPGMDVLFDLHRQRWKERHLPGAFLGRSIAFHREWAIRAAESGWLRLGLLHVDGQAIGAIYSMTMAGTAYYYQAGFDPAQGAVSPGTLLVASAVRRAIDEGARHFDFMRGDEGYKRRWKPQRELKNLRILVPASGAMGRLGSRWNAAGWRVEQRIRARLEGRGLL